MSKKERFIELVKFLMEDSNFRDLDDDEKQSMWGDALDFWNGLQMSEDNSKPKFTENGKLVLKYMQENREVFNNLFKAKEIGEGLGISSRTASGAMRKLVNDLYIEKIGENPVVYSLTDKGINVNVNEESQ